MRALCHTMEQRTLPSHVTYGTLSRHFVRICVIFFDKITFWHAFCKEDYVKTLQLAIYLSLSLQTLR